MRHEFRQPTAVAFLDFTAAFDSVDRGTIWSLLKMEGIPNKLVNLCASMYENTNCRVRAYGEDGHAFATKTGVRQGGILSPCLFNIAIDHVLKKALDDNPIGITICPSERPITDLTFADDIAVLAESMDSMQIMIDHIILMAASVGLKLNCQKSKYMTANTDPINPNSSLTIENEPMEQVTSFTYLGSNIALLGSSNEEVQTRIQRASSISSTPVLSAYATSLEMDRACLTYAK